MFRISSKLVNLSIEATPMYYQTVRWSPRNRKPLWLGTAKTKKFRVPVKPVIPDDEKEELKRLFNNYRTQIKSLRKFFYLKHSVTLMAQADTEQLKKDFDEDFLRCQKINNEWNEVIRKQREERLAKELKADIEFAKNRLAERIKKKEEVLAKAEEIVRREKEQSKYFVTPENIDRAIEEAINNPIDYNFAIDLNGDKIIGRENNPVEEKISFKN